MPPKTYCNRGHLLSGYNGYIKKRHGAGRTFERCCRKCDVINTRKYKLKLKEARGILKPARTRNEVHEANGKFGVKHGLTHHRLYNIWVNMRSRCQNPNNKDYPNYAGRGIKLCDEWLDVRNFVTWGEAAGYKKGLSIDRINNDGNYEPSNCRWATPLQQYHNRRPRVYSNKQGDIDNE